MKALLLMLALLCPVALRAQACLRMDVPPAAVTRTVDGDTFILWSVGVPPEERVRVLAVDAAELRDSLGPAARVFTIQWLAVGKFTLETCKRDSFGRLLATITRGSDTLAVDLIRRGLGVPK